MRKSDLISFRRATEEDVPLLAYWDEQEHVQKSDPDGDWNWERELKREPVWRQLLISMLADQPIGFMQIIDPKEEDTHYWGEIGAGYRAIDIWIGEKTHLNKGYGTQMMKLGLEKCFAPSEVHTVLIDPLASNTAAHRFYKRFGFQFVEEREFDGDLCWVFELSRKDWSQGN